MVQIFFDYKALVVQDYNQKKIANVLSPRLAQPTPAKLKKECIFICRERFDKRDEKALTTFFERSGDAKTFVQIIQRCETDRFRPLVNFLRNPTINTEDKNIELLAWLIDFKSRPYEIGKTYRANSQDVIREEQEAIDNTDRPRQASSGQLTYNIEAKEVPEIKPIVYGKPYKSLKNKSLIAALIVIIVVAIGFYFPKKNNKQGTSTSDSAKCMYWTGDHYELVSCTQKRGDTLVVGLDSVRLVQIRRITIPDTITYQSIGKVWYIKRAGKLEFYTAGGQHPVYPHIMLRPITGYIIDKYIKPAQ